MPTGIPALQRGPDALKFANARNEYLHGPTISSVTVPPEAWWPRYWALASILVTAQDREIEELVGDDRVGTVGATSSKTLRTSSIAPKR